MARKQSGPQIVTLPFPAKGINEDLSLEQLADSGYAAPTTLNVMPADWKGRRRGSVRGGLVTLGDWALAHATSGFDALCEFTPILSGTGPLAYPLLAARAFTFAAVGFPPGATDRGQNSYTFVAFDTPDLSEDSDITPIPAGTVCYFPNFTNIYIMQGNGTGSITVTDFTASTGSLPVAAFGCIYRTRLVVSGDPDQPQNFFASRAGTHSDWDYSQLDSAAAFAGNTVVGEAVTALVPHSSDLLIIATASSLFRMVGDIGYGGQIVEVSRGVGILNQRAWAVDDTGTLYFVGSGGFYRMDPNGFPESLSEGVVNDYFDFKRDDGGYNFSCTWDRTRKGVWITHNTTHQLVDSTTIPVQMFYHASSQSFWRVKFPATAGPFSIVNSRMNRNGDLDGAGRLLIGGIDSLYTLDDLAVDDYGTLISSQLDLGPITPGGPAYESKMLTLRAILGSAQDGIDANDQGAQIQVLAARDSQTVTGGSPTNSKNLGVLTPLFNVPQSVRVAGHSFVVRLSGDGVHPRQWSLDQIAVDFVPGGPAR